MSWNLTDFVNRFMCDPKLADELIPPKMLEDARQEAGLLSAGEVYLADPILRSMQMLMISREDALALHKLLRDKVDRDGAPSLAAPSSIAAALPVEHRAGFADAASADGDLPGLHLSSYIDWRRLLALAADGGYRLLFWKNDHRTGAPCETRLYTGQYKVLTTRDGDRFVRLGLALTEESLGSDSDDDDLFIMRSGSETWLLQATSIEDIATAIGGRGKMSRSDHYFRCARLADVCSPRTSSRP